MNLKQSLLLLTSLALALVSCKSEDAGDGDEASSPLPDKPASVEGSNGSITGVVSELTNAQIDLYCRDLVNTIYPNLIRALCVTTNGLSELDRLGGENTCSTFINMCLTEGLQGSDLSQGCVEDDEAPFISSGCMLSACIDDLRALRGASCEADVDLLNRCDIDEILSYQNVTAELACSENFELPNPRRSCDMPSTEVLCGFEEEFEQLEPIDVPPEAQDQAGGVEG